MRNFILIFLLFSIISCQKKKLHPYTFYYWKTHLQLNDTEQNALDKADVPILYTRFFDIDKINGKFQPVGVLTKASTFKTNKEIVPVVFITNRSFINIKKEEIPFLVQNIQNLISNKIKDFQFKEPQEIQIDCDWTSGTHSDYFEFLKQLQKTSNKKITATLRLHQIKDLKNMGVPPVEKGYLMCYSTSSPLENSDKNSILDVAVLKKYLRNLNQYPIKNIDIALPIYSWE